MRRHVLRTQTDALAQDQAGDQGRGTGVQVNDRTTGIVHRTSRAQPAAAPHPMGDRAIDEDQPQPHEPEEGAELHAVGQRAGDQGRGDDREGHLEEHVDRFRNRARQRGNAGELHRTQEQIAEAADPVVHALVGIGGEGQAVADHHPQHGDQRGGAEALRQRRQHILLAHHAAIEQAQARNGHHQHQRRGGQHPGGVARVQRILRRVGRIGHARRQSQRAGGDQRRHARFLQLFESHLFVPLLTARRCRFRRCGCARPVPAASRKSCRPRSGRSSPWW